LGVPHDALNLEAMMSCTAQFFAAKCGNHHCGFSLQFACDQINVAILSLARTQSEEGMHSRGSPVLQPQSLRKQTANLCTSEQTRAYAASKIVLQKKMLFWQLIPFSGRKYSI